MLDDGLFDGRDEIQFTHAALRATTLAALGPSAGRHLFDVGAGTGSVGIEWLAAGGAHATFLEHRADMCAHIGGNLARAGVLASATLVNVPAEAFVPAVSADAIFIGCAGMVRNCIILKAFSWLRRGGRLIVNVTTPLGRLRIEMAQRSVGGLVRYVAGTAAQPPRYQLIATRH